MIKILLQILLLHLNNNNRKSEPVRLGKKQTPTIPLNITLIIITVIGGVFFILMLLLALHGVSMTESGQLYNMGV